MEIVLALAAVVGISLIAVPRLRRRSRGRVRADAGKQWTTSAAARRRRPAAGARSSWSGRHTAAAAGGTTATALATEPYDEWDDDLDWGGETAVDAPPAAPAAPLPESDLDWQLPGAAAGTGDAVAEPAEERQWDDWPEADHNGNGHGAAAPVDDDAPAATVGTPDRASRHDDARPDAPGTEAPDEVADQPTEADWDWEPVVSRRAEPAAAPAATAPGRGDRIRARGRKVNPLVLVALYAAFGIGVIVIAVTVVSGAVSGPDTNRAPRTSATVEPTPEPTPPAASGAANAEAKRLQQAFLDQSGVVIAQENAAARHARAAARRARAAHRKARAARRRAAARRAAHRRAAAPPTHVDPAPAAPTPAAPVAPAPSGGGGGGGGCEFCIG